MERLEEGIVVTEVGGEILLRNARLFQLLGEDLIPARHVDEMIAIVEASGRDGERQALVRFLAAGEGKPRKFVLRTREGSAMVVSVTHSVGHPVDGPHRAAETRIAVLRDVSDLVAAQNFQQQILSMASHDLRSPLAAITTNAGVLGRPGEMLEEKRVKGAGRILSSSKRMSRMIEELVDYTRAAMGEGVPLILRNVDLAVLCEAAIQEAKGSFPGRTIELETVGDLKGEWDGDRLTQVLQGLIVNGLKHGDGQKSVSVRVSETRSLKNGGLNESGGVTIDVVNFGFPLEPTLLTQIFEAHKRAGIGGERGVGIALYIGRLIVEAHKGTIAATSSAGLGTCFRVTLPKRQYG